MPSHKKTTPVPDVVTQAVAARLILRQVRALEAEIPGVQASEDIEAVHRMRVASRRLRANLMVFESVLPQKPLERWQVSVKGLTRALGAARDLDVQLDHVTLTLSQTEDPAFRRGLRRLILRLQQQRSKRQKAVIKVVTSWQKAKTGTGIITRIGGWETRLPDQLPPPSIPLADLACESILDHLATFLGYAPCLDDPQEIEPLHAMRIAAKWLRYTLESFDYVWSDAFKDQLAALRSAQETLGTIHDCDVWSELLPKLIQQESDKTLAYFGHLRPLRRVVPGMEYYQTLRAEERVRLFDQYNADWAVWQQSGVWDALRETVLRNSAALQLKGNPTGQSLPETPPA